MITESSYVELVDSCCHFNKRIAVERKLRLPFLDSQTGVAQSHSNLWRNARERQTVSLSAEKSVFNRCYDEGVVFSYPAKRWRRRPNNNVNLLIADVKSRNACLAPSHDVNATANTGVAEAATGEAVPDPAAGGENRTMPLDLRSESNDGGTRSSMATESQHNATSNIAGWYDDADPLADDPYFEDPNSDGEDYEERKRKRGTKKKGSSGRSRRQTDLSDTNKPHTCPHCGAKYKTKPGLQYHVTHQHSDGTSAASAPANPLPDSTCNRQPDPVAPDSQEDSWAPTTAGKMPAAASRYCDFCLGDADQNKKTLRAEQLVSCKDCGRSGHPTCLQFTPNMVVSTKRHGWQCIDCKSCAMCGTSENDDQLLFCDDCDRGFHMYCLKPPLMSAPEGNWSCHLCIEEFGAAASNPGS